MDSVYAIDASGEFWPNTFWSADENTGALIEHSAIYSCVPGCPSPDHRNLADFVAEAESAPREPGCRFRVWDWPEGRPDTTPDPAFSERHWVVVGPVEGPHTRLMASLAPGPAQRDAEARLLANPGRLTCADVTAFLADYHPSSPTLRALLDALPADSAARTVLAVATQDALDNLCRYEVEDDCLDTTHLSPSYSPSSPRHGSPKREHEPDELRAAKRHKNLSN